MKVDCLRRALLAVVFFDGGAVVGDAFLGLPVCSRGSQSLRAFMNDVALERE